MFMIMNIGSMDWGNRAPLTELIALQLERNALTRTHTYMYIHMCTGSYCEPMKVSLH